MIEEMQANATYTKIVTSDGSPTIRMTTAEFAAEDMHHSGGALSESLFIYAEIVRAALNFNLPPKIMSVGLGLGYNEAVAVAEVLAFEQRRHVFLEKLVSPRRIAPALPTVRILSFEKDEIIRERYMSWLLNKSPDDFWTPIFNEVLARVAKKYGFSDGHLKREMSRLYREDCFRILGAIESYNELTSDRFSIVLYDAFSTKAMPQLWEELFLTNFLTSVSEPFCFFSTYASLSGLNRALESTGFMLDIHRGFANKRNATWAYRLSGRLNET